MMSTSSLHNLKALSSNLDELGTILHQIQNDPQALASLPAVLASCPDTRVEQWCEHCLETLNPDLGSVLIAALSPSQKSSLEQSSSVRMQVALIGEYGYEEWIDILKIHWPEIVVACVDNAIRIFEARAAEEKKVLQIVPNIEKGALITCIQEKVLRNYMDLLSSEHLTRYIQANIKNDREPDATLQSFHERLLLTHATKDFGTEPHRRIKI